MIKKYIASEGKVFDWADTSIHMVTDDDINFYIDHLYAKEIEIDDEVSSIDNYVEVDEDVVKLTHPL